MSRYSLLLVAMIFDTGVSLADEPLPAAEAASTCQLPPGFKMTVLASEPDIKQPIGFCMDDRARLWVAEAYSYPVHTKKKSKDRIVILEDVDGDGKHDKRTVFYEGLNYVTGIEYGFGGAWVMSPPYLYFIPDRDRDDRPDSEPQILLDGFGNHDNAHNLANGFAWGPDGWLYGTHGRTKWSMIGKPGTSKDQRKRLDGGVYRYHPVRHVWEPYADGTTNPWGIDWNDYGHAFICNCVNPHLFQVIQGAHYEPWRGRKSSQYAYQRIGTVADHLHFTGLSHIRKGVGSKAEDEAGGGHAHCGTMIYLGDSFPPEYRGTLFTNNVHGRRINNDHPKRIGSGYTASHRPDLMRASDPWFMGVTLAYGPLGEVYVSDWSDTGECHSRRNTKRKTGRVYRITYGQHRLDQIDLTEKSSLELAELQLHQNDWHVRHARRLLHERASAGENMSAVKTRLLKMFHDEPTIPRKLRAMWCLHVLGALDESFLLTSLSHKSEDIRSWAVTLLCEAGNPTNEALQEFIRLAKHGTSPLVRLSLASALQRLSFDCRWELAAALADQTEDTNDANLPLMIWYGSEPLVREDLSRFVDFAVGSRIPRIRINAARRIAESKEVDRGLELLSKRLSGPLASEVSQDLLTGVLQGLKGRRKLRMPPSWRAAFARLSKADNPKTSDLTIRLAVVFKDRKALTELRKVANDKSELADRRSQAVDVLVGQKVSDFDTDLLKMVSDTAVRSSALRGLASFNSPNTAKTILSQYESMTAGDRQHAQLTLASRKSWTHSLLDAVSNGRIKASELTAYAVRQMRSLDDTAINEKLVRHWGGLRETTKTKAKQISRIKRWLTTSKLQQADMDHGRKLFTKHCASCHRLFGEGGTIGPDITGAQRHNLDYMLENIIAPSAAVAKDFQMHVLRTVDGRVINGLIASETADTITIQTINEKLVLPVEDIEERAVSDVSIMPEIRFPRFGAGHPTVLQPGIHSLDRQGCEKPSPPGRTTSNQTCIRRPASMTSHCFVGSAAWPFRIAHDRLGNESCACETVALILHARSVLRAMSDHANRVAHHAIARWTELSAIDVVPQSLAFELQSIHHSAYSTAATLWVLCTLRLQPS